MGFDPKTDEGANISSRHKTVKRMYEKLVARGDDEAAEALRHAGDVHEQARFVRQEVPEFDPKHDEGVNTSTKMSIKNVYDALVELGHDQLAEELRGRISVQGQGNRAWEIVDEVDAEIDPVTGEIESPKPDSRAEA